MRFTFSIRLIELRDKNTRHKRAPEQCAAVTRAVFVWRGFGGV